jgi:hypothetical protein
LRLLRRENAFPQTSQRNAFTGIAGPAAGWSGGGGGEGDGTGGPLGPPDAGPVISAPGAAEPVGGGSAIGAPGGDSQKGEATLRSQCKAVV